jgi:hypothetical protein
MSPVDRPLLGRVPLLVESELLPGERELVEERGEREGGLVEAHADRFYPQKVTSSGTRS